MLLNQRSISRSRCSAIAAAVLTALAGGFSSAAFAGEITTPTTAPTTQPMVRSDAAISADLKAASEGMNKALSNAAMFDPAKRAAAAPAAIPYIKRMVALLHEYGAAHNTESMYVTVQLRFESMLYLLGDKETVDRINLAAASPTVADNVHAQMVQLNARWLGTGKDPVAQKSIADDLEKLDIAHPDSDDLTMLTVSMANTAVSSDVRSHMRDLATKTMTSSMAKRMAKSVKDKTDSEKTLASLTGKPLTISSTTVDGKPFSTEEYKGKVILVDFWATWCGPCKAELPRVKELYAKYHDKGLEIVGVSNDYSAEAVKKFTPANDMPWVELLDAKAADDHQWNPTTIGYGIRGIPTMFLIDKKGVLRTVEAREEMETLIPTLLAE